MKSSLVIAAGSLSLYPSISLSLSRARASIFLW